MNAIRPLDRIDIDAVLGRRTVGRLAYMRGDRIDIVPVNYVYREGSIFGRTSNGKLDYLAGEAAQVSFQVDEIRTGKDWRSVLVYGALQIVTPDMGEEGWMTALGAVRRLQTKAMRSDDPHPERGAIFRIVISEVAGRAMG